MTDRQLLSFEDFRREYERRHPASVPVRATARHEYNSFILSGVIAMFVASAILSGVHTAPTIYAAVESDLGLLRLVAALASFVAIEMSLLLSTFMRGKRLARIVVLVSFAVAVSSNVYSTGKALTATTDQIGGQTNEQADPLAVIVSVILGVGAPLIALMSGEMLVQIGESRRTTASEIDKDFNDAEIKWDAHINDQYERYAKRLSGGSSARLSALPARAPALPAADGQADRRTSGQADTTDGQPLTNGHSTGQGYGKNMSAREQAMAYLIANPSAATMTTRALETQVGIARKTVWGEVLSEFRSRPPVGTPNGVSADPAIPPATPTEET